jgi:hypothetical protein
VVIVEDGLIYEWDDRYDNTIVSLESSEYISTVYPVQDMFYLLYLYHRSRGKSINVDIDGRWRFFFKMDNSKYLKISEYGTVVYTSQDEKKNSPINEWFIKDAVIKTIAMISEYADKKYNGLASSMLLLNSLSKEDSERLQKTRTYFKSMGLYG